MKHWEHQTSATSPRRPARKYPSTELKGLIGPEQRPTLPQVAGHGRIGGALVKPGKGRLVAQEEVHLSSRQQTPPAAHLGAPGLGEAEVEGVDGVGVERGERGGGGVGGGGGGGGGVPPEGVHQAEGAIGGDVSGLVEATEAVSVRLRRPKVRLVPPEGPEAGDEPVGDLVAQGGQIHRSSLGGGGGGVILRRIVAQLGAEDGAVGVEEWFAGISLPLPAPFQAQHPVQAAGDDPPKKLLQVLAEAGVGSLFANFDGKILDVHGFLGVVVQQPPPRCADGGTQRGQPLCRLLGAPLRQPGGRFRFRLQEEFAELPRHLVDQLPGRLPNWLTEEGGGHISPRQPPRVDGGHQVGAALHHRRPGHFRLRLVVVVAGEDRPQPPAHQVVVAVDGRPAEVVDQQLVGGGGGGGGGGGSILDQAGQPLKVRQAVHALRGQHRREGGISDHRQQADPVDQLRGPFRAFDLGGKDAQLHPFGPSVGVSVEEVAAAAAAAASGEERPVRAARLRQGPLQGAHLADHLLQSAIGDALVGPVGAAVKEEADVASQAFHLRAPARAVVVCCSKFGAHVNVAPVRAGKVNRKEGLKIEQEELGVDGVPPPVFVITTTTLAIFVIYVLRLAKAGLRAAESASAGCDLCTSVKALLVELHVKGILLFRTVTTTTTTTTSRRQDAPEVVVHFGSSNGVLQVRRKVGVGITWSSDDWVAISNDLRFMNTTTCSDIKSQNNACIQ
ncbi:hypothetical protein TYRP_018661 [Tyrophagus putrescentiae]|nr:hypothetical protein TYRP_018661 [Tyrophagus putrescentiae]